MKNNNPRPRGPQPQVTFASIAAPYVPALMPAGIQTGSDVLDRLLAQFGAHSGQVIYLEGGQAGVQRAALLGFCKAACDRGESSVFFDLSGTLDAQTIRRVGLSAYYNASRPDDPNALFRVLSPGTPALLDAELQAVIQASSVPVPLVVVIEGLPELLHRQYGPGKASSARAGGVLHKLIQKAQLLVSDLRCTVWITHTPFHYKNKGVRPSALPTKFNHTVQNTLRKYADYEVELGRAISEDNGASDFFIRVRLRRYRTPLAKPRRIVMDEGGQFKNPRTY